MSGAAWAVIIGIHLVGLIDLYLYVRYGPSAMLSPYIYRIAVDYPIVTLLTGLVLGHLFWPQHPTTP